MIQPVGRITKDHNIVNIFITPKKDKQIQDICSYFKCNISMAIVDNKAYWKEYKLSHNIDYKLPMDEYMDLKGFFDQNSVVCVIALK